MNDKQNKTKGSFANVLKKTADFSKKAAAGIQSGAKNLSEQTKQNLHNQKMKRYNPLFLETFESADFKIPNIIEIVDDAIRKNIDVCDGAIGWTDKVNDVEVLHLYDEYMVNSKIQFVPFPKCDEVYCVDNFDRSKFINVSAAFERTTSEKLAELEHIAFCLGAKSCSIELLEANENKTTTRSSASAKYADAASAQADVSNASRTSNHQHGKSISFFEGNNTMQMPTLKWFKYDDSVNRLIEMRCSGNNTIKSKVLEIKCSTSVTMSTKVACAIDKIKVKSSVSLEKQSLKELNSRLIFDVEF